MKLFIPVLAIVSAFSAQADSSYGVSGAGRSVSASATLHISVTIPAMATKPIIEQIPGTDNFEVTIYSNIVGSYHFQLIGNPEAGLSFDPECLHYGEHLQLPVIDHRVPQKIYVCNAQPGKPTALLTSAIL
jgi:hypothetical protein